MFSKAYIAGFGIMLFVVGTLFSFVGNMSTGLCAKIDALPKAPGIAFNPCTIFAAVPRVALAMQGLGALIAIIMIFFIIKEATKPVPKCPKCGLKAPEKANFCPACGTEIRQVLKCPNCGQIAPGKSRFCPNCKAQLPQLETKQKPQEQATQKK